MIENNITPIVIVLGAVLLLGMALIVYLFWRTRRIESDYELLIRDSKGQNFAQIVSDNIEQADALLLEVERLSEQYAQVLRRMAGSVQHVGVVRFDAFRDLGGMLSFAVALLDDRGNGLAFSSIYGRSESRTYAKPIVERGSSYELSPEEKEAIRLAMQSKELGALPVEARDPEHEERMANLRLFHDREYLQSSDQVEGRPVEARRPRPPEEERRPVTRPVVREEGPRQERSDEPAPREVNAREEGNERRPAQARRGAGRVRHVGPPAEKPARCPEKASPDVEEPAPEKRERPVDLVAELEIDKPFAGETPPVESERTERAERERPISRKSPESSSDKDVAKRPAASKPRGRKPKSEPRGE
jgi:hypothetical protein